MRMKDTLFEKFVTNDSLQSADEREMCTRTVYCTNIDKKVDTCFSMPQC